jgi:hypothetical protein
VFSLSSAATACLLVCLSLKTHSSPSFAARNFTSFLLSPWHVSQLRREFACLEEDAFALASGKHLKRMHLLLLQASKCVAHSPQEASVCRTLIKQRFSILTACVIHLQVHAPPLVQCVCQLLRCRSSHGGPVGPPATWRAPGGSHAHAVSSDGAHDAGRLCARSSKSGNGWA